MKHVGSFFSQLAAYGVALLVTSLVISAQAQQQGEARVMKIDGAADYSEAGGAWQKLTVGKVLTSGAVIKTAMGARVALNLKQNGPVVVVTEDTTLGIDKLTFDQTGSETVIDTELNLQNGRILGHVKKLSELSKYNVKIPNGTVGIRGTDYDISASGLSHCVKGSFIVMWGTPVTPFVVNAGQTFTPPTPGGTPSVGPTSPDYVWPGVETFGPTEVVIVTPEEKPISPVTQNEH
jgi:hypothetical protein